MQIRYKHQRFQTEAARSIVNAFTGQPKSDGQSDHTIDQGKNKGLFKLAGFGNKNVVLAREAVCENVRAVQTEQGLKPVDYLQDLQGVGMAFTIEMETGTGKTYTYIKTMYELNERYGWTKFVVVVPSIAIREGVLKSFESMQEHFAQEYNGKRMQYFVYNSKQLSKIDAFASDAGMHVMIINTQAFNSSFDEDSSKDKMVKGKVKKADKTARIIFDKRDEFNSRRPIDVLSQCHPIMIIDEPQSVLGVDKGNKTRKGLAQFKPLFTLLYSATHRKGDIYNMMFRLDAIDAYNQKLVKKIEVKGIKQIGSTATNGYVYLEEIIISKGNPQARISFDVKTATGIKQTSKVVRDDDKEKFDLYAQSGKLNEYKNNFIVERIDGVEGTVRFVNGLVLHEGDAVGAVNEDYLRRIQIRETIRTHLERERQLFGQKIKVLSLFFIDHVDSYRLYEGPETKGKFAKMFEEEYRNVLSELMPTFGDEAYLRYLSDPRNAAEKIHQGYFSMDKKGKIVDSKNKEGENEERAFDLIMKDKERLLSLKEPVRFIFSHSALKEGWDNPNVFQICTLKNSDNETMKHQEVGRGMRLCVNQNGERQDADVLGDHVFDTNILTIIASESYEGFAKGLQDAIAKDCGDRPSVITPNLFEGKTYTQADGTNGRFDLAQARAIYNVLIRKDYVNDEGTLTAEYYEAKRNGTLNFDKVNNLKDGIIAALDTVFNPSAIKPENARKSKFAKFQKENFDKKEFQELWKRINQRTYYQVNFDTSDLVKKSIKALDDNLKVTEIRIVVEGGSLDNVRDKESLEAGVAMTQGNTRTIHVTEAIGKGVTYDLIGKLVTATGLTRKTIVEILKGIKPETFYRFKQNPEEFIIKAGLIINDCKALAVIQCIKYEKLNDKFSTDIFTENMLRGKLGINAIESAKSLYDLVVLDSMGTEKNFAESLEHEDDVVVYTKLPNGFYINTPMGKYNPDWAVAFKEGSVKHVYFVAESKGNDLQGSQLRGSEESKIECARRHFKAISDNGYIYDVAKDYKSLYDIVTK